MNKYECELCDSTFKLNVELRIHIRKEHSQIPHQQKTTKFNTRGGPSEKPAVDHPSSKSSNNNPSTTKQVLPGPTSQEKKFKLSLNSVTPVFGEGISAANDNASSSRDDSSSVTSSCARKTTSIKSQSSSSSHSSNNNNNGRSWNYQRRVNQVQDDDDDDEYSDEDAENENSDKEQDEEDEEETKQQKSNTTTTTTMGSHENDKKQNRKSAPQKRTSTTDNGDDHSEKSSDDNGMNIETGEQINVQNIHIQQRTTCTYCNRVLSNLKSLVLHNRKYHHSNETTTTTTFISPTYFPRERPRMFSCIKCTKKYESNNLLWKHRINSCGLASKYKCKFCFKQHKLLWQSLDCAKSHTRAQLTKFKEELELERQRKQQQKQVNVQKVEADLFSNFTSNNQKQKSSSVHHKCFYKTCNKVFKDRSQLSEHGLAEHKICMCIYCDSILLSQNKLDKHYAERHSNEPIVVNDKCNSGAFNDSHKQNKEENQSYSEYENDIVHTKVKSSTHSNSTELIDSDETASVLTNSTTDIKEEIDIEDSKKPFLGGRDQKEEEEAMQVDEKPSVTNEENFDCKICGINCMSSFALEIHSRKHQTFLKCAVCSEKFVSTELLENHIKQCHSFKSQKEPSRTMNCVQCGQIFTKLKDYIRHKRQHQISVASASTEETDTDGKTDADDTDSSSMDNFPTTNGESKRSSRIRRQRSPEINIKCELCQTEFHRQSHYDYHVTRELCKEKAENEYKCNKCDQSFRRLTTLENHKRSHSEPKDTSIHEAEEDSFISYNQHRPNNKQQHQLEKLDASRFKKPIQLNHRKRRQESPHITSSDDESLPLQNKKIARIQPQSPKIQRNNKQGGEYFAQTTDHKCVECLSIFSTSQELALHLLEHNRIKMRQAEIAKYEKETEQQYQQQQQQPSQLQPPTKFMRASRKTGISLHTCPICGLQRFKTRIDMIDHVKSRHQRLGEYGCPYSDSCRKLCKSALEVCEHVDRHEKQAEIDGNGDLLVEENTRSRSIIKSDNKVQPRIQEERSNKSNNKPGPQRTMNKIMTNPIQSSTKKTSTSSSNNSSRSHDTSRNIPCPVCKKAMDSRIQLKSHILSSHMDRSFKFCPKPSCSVLFHDQSGLKRHLSEGNCVI